ncbi:CMP-sialic acid transporter isoform X2 [Oncorhynchus tshawytscha]|uniref:Solute carrier family 35 member A1 n=2 Tax=Oncorhynchus TaxID=8016 RepID=A0A8C7CFK1_ONCKI|nr:CMP-sialic acid transporter isoform X2 [Oncorhynchus tshawytscha]XP_042177520.1 CMP-sialic acid transporter isoform X2 [Oncorhynchus tshawytscha]
MPSMCDFWFLASLTYLLSTLHFLLSRLCPLSTEPVSVVFKVYCLSVMTMVAATYTVVLRYTRTISSTAMYFSTTAVCVTEVIKLFLSLGMLTKEAGSFGRLKASIVEHVFQCPKELLKLSVPSVVYAIQNNMAFIALSNLDAAVYQVTYQLKIPCTALCMVLMLNRSLSRLQWLSVCMLCGGVALVQWKPAEATKVQVEQNPFWGFMAIAIAVFCSGFAGVYFEKVLKSSDTSLWVRNIQMYLSGIVVTLAVVYMTEGTQVIQKGFFYGYTPWVCFAVFLASVGGLYTSVVVKYTDNIMKGFSAAAAIVLSTVASVALFGLQITVNFASGAMLVCISIYLYGLPKQDTTKLPRADKDAKQKLITV